MKIGERGWSWTHRCFWNLEEASRWPWALPLQQGLAELQGRHLQLAAVWQYPLSHRKGTAQQ